MGWLSALGKIGGAIAAPFTGGASLIPTILGGVGDVAGKMSSGRAQGRQQEANYGLQRDALGMQAQQQGIQNDTTRYQQALRLAMLGGAQDANIQLPDHLAGHMPTMSGGLRPSMLDRTPVMGPDGQPTGQMTGHGALSREDIIQSMQPRILQALMNGETYKLAAAPQAGGFDKFLNLLGGTGAFAGAVQNSLGPAYQSKVDPKAAASAMPVNKIPVDPRNIGGGAFVPYGLG